MTTQNQIASQYRELSARGSTPVGLVVKLYDAILEDFRQALAAIAAGDIERRVARINHAMLIIAELESVLDYKRGGVVAQRLRGFYDVTRAMIVEANARVSREMFEKIIELYVPVRHAWQQVDQDLTSGKTQFPASSDVPVLQPAARVSNQQREAVGVGAEPDAPTSQWSA
jgi:flagellar protein FliS